jgi:glucokinase
MSWGSEGGHAEWAPRTSLEFELAQWLMTKYADEGSARRISLERIISGNGLCDIYEYLATEKYPE